MAVKQGQNMKYGKLLLFLFIVLCTLSMNCSLALCANLEISGVLNDGQGDFDPWNTTRWAAWYNDDGDLLHAFDIDCSVKFATRSTVWEIDLSERLDTSYPFLFKVDINAGIDIDGNGLVIDARTDALRSVSLWDFYNSYFNTDDFNYWRGFYFAQTSASNPSDPCTVLHDIELYGFRHALSFDHLHKRAVVVQDCIFKTNVWGIFPRSSGVVVKENTFKENLLGGLYCEYTSNNWTIENNIFKDNNTKGHPAYGDIVLDACHDITIKNNQFLPPTYDTRDYRTAISLYRNRGEDENIREYASKNHLIENNSFQDYLIAIDFSPREGRIDVKELSLEGRCYSNNNTVRNCTFEDCMIGLNIRSHFNHVENNTFTNVDKEIVLFNVFYKSLGNTIINQPGTTVWLWGVPSDYSAYYDYVIPYAMNVGEQIDSDEKIFFIRSDGSATITDPSPSELIIADTLLIPDDRDYNQDLVIDMLDMSRIVEYWLDGNCSSISECIAVDLNADNYVNMSDFSDMANGWGNANDLTKTYSHGGRPIDMAVGDFATYLDGDEIAVIWDQPVSKIDDTEYYTIIIYDCNGLELDRCGRSTCRWDKITAGNFLPDTGYWRVDEDYEIAAVSSSPDANGHYPISVFRKGWVGPAVKLLNSNVDPVADIAAGNFNLATDDYDEVAVVFAEGPTDITYLKPSDVSWSSTTTTSYRLEYIAAGDFDGVSSNADEVAGVVLPDATENLIAAWDFETTGSGIYGDKAPAGNVQDDLSLIGDVNVIGGKAVMTQSVLGTLKANDSDDLDLSGSFTIWVRTKVLDDPTRHLLLVNKRQFDPEQRSYGFLINHPDEVEGGDISDYFGIGGQVSEDGDNGDNDFFDGDGQEVIPIGQVRELVMRCSEKGDLQAEWFASTTDNPTSASHWQLVNGMTCNTNVESIFNSTTDLYLGTTTNLTTPCSTIEFYEVRIYNDWLSTDELAAIVPSDMNSSAGPTNPIYYFKVGATGNYSTSAVTANHYWSGLAAGNFDNGNPDRDEIAAVNAESGEIEYYVAASQRSFKTAEHNAMKIQPLAIGAGDPVVGQALSSYERCDGFTSSDYDAEISTWGNCVVVLPYVPKRDSAIGAYWLNNSLSDEDHKYHKVTPLLR